MHIVTAILLGLVHSPCSVSQRCLLIRFCAQFVMSHCLRDHSESRTTMQFQPHLSPHLSWYTHFYVLVSCSLVRPLPSYTTSPTINQSYTILQRHMEPPGCCPQNFMYAVTFLDGDFSVVKCYTADSSRLMYAYISVRFCRQRAQAPLHTPTRH